MWMQTKRGPCCTSPIAHFIALPFCSFHQPFDILTFTIFWSSSSSLGARDSMRICSSDIGSSCIGAVAMRQALVIISSVEWLSTLVSDRNAAHRGTRYLRMAKSCSTAFPSKEKSSHRASPNNPEATLSRSFNPKRTPGISCRVSGNFVGADSNIAAGGVGSTKRPKLRADPSASSVTKTGCEAPPSNSRRKTLSKTRWKTQVVKVNI